MKNMRHYGMFFLLSFLVAASVLSASDVKDTREVIKPGKDYTEISAAGVKLKLPKDAVRSPLPPPDSRVGKRNGQTVDVFFPKELWEHEQTVSFFKGPGFSVSVFLMTLPYPSELMGKKGENRVSRSEFENWKNTNKFTPESLIDTDSWVKNLTGGKMVQSQTGSEIPSSSTAVQVARYNLEGENFRNRYLYIIQGKNRQGKIFVQVSLENQKDYSAAWKTVDQLIAQSVFITPGSGKEEDAKILKSTAAKNTQRSKEYVMDSAAVVESIKGLKKWYSMEGDGFIILSDASTRKDTEIIMSETDAAIKSYQTLFPMVIPQTAPMVVRVVDTMAEMKEHCPWEHTPGSFWNNDKKEVVVCPSYWKDFSKRPDGMLRSLHSSTVAQYVFTAMNKSYSYPWFHNGMVSVFSDIDVKAKGKYEVVFDRDREKNIQQRGLDGINGKFGKHVADIIKITHEDISRSRQWSSYNDTLWAFFYFLVKGAPVVKGQEGYAEIPAKFCTAFIKNKYNAKKATQEAFEGVDMNKLDKDMRDFWNSKNLVGKSRTYTPKPIIVTLPDSEEK